MSNLEDEIKKAQEIEDAFHLELERDLQLSSLSSYQHKLYRVTKWNKGGSERFGVDDTRRSATDLNDANLISSELADEPDVHTVMLDLDVPACLIPSSTPGNSHLYIDVKVNWEKYSALLKALAEAGVIEQGFHSASVSRRCTSLRLPWVKREDERPK